MAAPGQAQAAAPGDLRLDVVQRFLQSVGLNPTSFYALYGPTASRRELPPHGRSVNLPLSQDQRETVLSALYCHVVSKSNSATWSLDPVPERVGLILDMHNTDPKTQIHDEGPSLDILKAANWSVTTAQRAIQQARQKTIASAKSTQAPHLRSAVMGRSLSSKSEAAMSTSSLRGTSPAINSESAEDPALFDPEYGEERRGMPCGHVFQKGEAIWRCRDCALDDTCVQCAPCFMASVHNREGHDVVFSVSSSSGGCCDCGDEEAWVKDVGCSYHSVSKGDRDVMDTSQEETASADISPEHLAEDIIRTLLSQLPSDTYDRLRGLLQLWTEFVLVVLDHAPSEQKLFPRSFARSSASDAIRKLEEMPDLSGYAFQSSYQQTAESYMPHQTPLPPGAYASDKTPGSFDSAAPATLEFCSPPADVDTPGMRWGTLPPEPPTPALGRTREYALILWNDEKHSFREVIDTVKEALDLSETQARDVAERVDRNGRDILAVSSDIKLLVTYARKMAGIDLEVTIRPAYDVYCEELAHWVIHAIKDISEATYYFESDSMPGQLTANPATTRLLLTSILLEEWSPAHRQPLSFSSPQMSKEFFDSSRLRKLDGMLLMDQKLWKEVRGWVRAWYMNVIARKEGRRAVSFRFATVYPKVVETFILREREPEHSVMLITVQLFSVPSIASDLVRNLNFLERLLTILRAIYTGQLVPMTRTLHLPPEAPARGLASTQSTLIRGVYCRHIFYDVRYILQSQGVQEQIVSEERHLAYFLDFLGLFNAFLPEVRQTQHHVEYESEMWVAVFSVCQLLAKQAKLFGEAYAKALPRSLSSALSAITHKALLCSLTQQRNDPAVFEPIAFHDVEFGCQRYSVVDFKVDKQAVSFHHPVQWFWAEALKHLTTWTTDGAIQELGVAHCSQVIDSVDEHGMLVVLDSPLRVIVKIAQVKAGLWVRNGAPTRGQATHYRDVAMKSIMYDQDLFALQAGLAVIASPDRLLVSYLDRYRVLGYFAGREHSSEGDEYTAIIDQSQQSFFAEEFLLLLITLLSEHSFARSWPIEAIIRRETIHFLALGQGTYSALTRHIPEHMTSHPCFERVLAQVSNFRPPDGTTDLGIFELKDECYSDVDTFFYHYSRNQRERADEQLREREKRFGRSADDLVIAPPQGLLTGTPGIFASSLGRVFFCETFQLILINGLAMNCRSEVLSEEISGKEHSEAIVDATLQLIMIGLVEAQAEFIECTLTPMVHAQDERSIVQTLCDIEPTLKTKALKAKVAWCLDRCSENPAMTPTAAGLIATHRQVFQRPKAASVLAGKSLSKSSLDTRRAAAKARQQAIIRKFNAQQKSFLETLEGENSGATSIKKEGTSEDMDVDMKLSSEAVEDAVEEEEPALGSCILCQEELRCESPFGSLALITHSRMIRTTPRGNLASLSEVVDMPLTLDREDSGRLGHAAEVHGTFQPRSRVGTSGGGFPRGDHKSGLYATTCGHLMHVRCFDGYYRSIEQRHAAQIARNHAEDLNNNEFVCPLCKSLGNVLLPVPWSKRSSAKAISANGEPVRRDPAASLGHQQLDTSPIGDWLRKINIDILKTSSSHGGPAVQESTTGTGCFTAWFADSSLPALWDSSSKIILPEGIDEPTMMMLDRLMHVLKPLATSTRPQRVAWQTRTILAPISRKLYLPEELVAYTLSALEASQRGTMPKVDGSAAKSNVAAGLNHTTINLLRSLIFCLRSIAIVDAGASNSSGSGNKPPRAGVNNGNAALRQAALRQGILKRLLPHWSSDESVRFPLLLRDPLAILVESVAIIPECLVQITTLMYYAALTQTVFGLAQPSVWPQATASASGSGGAGSLSRGLAHLPAPRSLSAQEEAALEECFPDVRWTVGNIVGFVGYARGNVTLGIDSLDNVSLAKLLCSYTLPFLRRAAILRRVLCGDENIVDDTYTLSEPVEYLRLLRYLQIISPAQALPVRAERQAPISSIVEGWIKHAYAPLASLFRPLPINPSPLAGGADGDGASLDAFAGSAPLSSNHQGLIQAHHPTLQLEHPHVYELIALPPDLTSLLQYSQRTRCRRCDEVPPDPALCLLCGELVCYQTFCCMDQETERGECNRHVAECGGNVGIFFKMKANVLFCLYNSNGSFTFSPYLDSHGEIDVGLQKGRPQKLHWRRYDELRKTWLQGGMPTLVARKLEGSMNIGGWITT